MDEEFLCKEVLPEHQPSKVSRLHELDWLRSILILCVVFVHATRINLVGNAFEHHVQVDNRDWTMTGAPSPYTVRWISFLRAFVIPLLFWVSGAANACSFKADFKIFMRTLGKISAYTIIGISCNAAIVYAGPGPEHPDCDPSHPCGTNILKFTVTPESGPGFPLVFQMWFTLMLMVLMILNWPLSASFSSSKPGKLLILQWSFTSLLYVYLAQFTKDPATVCIVTIASEAAFLSMAFLVHQRPAWLPLRVVHYGLAAISILQFGSGPMVSTDDITIDLKFLFWVLIGTTRSYGNGFILAFPRVKRTHDDAKPVVSYCWPVMLIVFVFVTPSTNWDQAGFMGFPYLPRLSDRCLYVAAQYVAKFCIDRLGRWAALANNIRPLPHAVYWTTLVLYICHPVLFVLWSLAGVLDPLVMWMLCFISAFIPVCLSTGVLKKQISYAYNRIMQV